MFLALCLQEGQVGERTWQEWLPLAAFAADAPQIAAYLVEQGYLDNNGRECYSSGRRPSDGSGTGTS